MWTSKRDLVTMHGAEASAIRSVLHDAHWDEWEGDECTGKTVANLFFEDSTRTRVSFSMAAGSLGARPVDLTALGSSMSKGETLLDTVWTIESMGFSAIVIRHGEDDAAAMVASRVHCPVINAGSGRSQHPTQALGDALVIGEAHDRTDGWDFSGLRVVIVGDIVSSRVAGSNIDSLRMLGAEIVLVGPGAMVPDGFMGCTVERDLDGVIESADAVMMLRIQFERGAGELVGARDEYVRDYQLSEQRAKAMKPGAIVMHPGPMNRDLEIASAVADGGQSKIRKQVNAGVRVRRAVLNHALDG
ncbi:MAG: aspartate carbamoyltransferase catalytic subunit [Phycisphaerales bacterium]|nr:aspartate carbamoyltransferase catalytic subunit [Phycisphaerales bacterium]